MTDNGRLERSLARLGARREASRILRSGPRPLLASLLATAEDIILERHLTLTPDTGPGFGMIVANRRLLGLSSDAHPDLTEAANAALQAGFTAGDDEALDRIRDWFDAHLDGAGRVRVTIGIVPEDRLQQSVGVAAEVLADALSLDLAAVEDEHPVPAPTALIDHMQAALTPQAKDWIRLQVGAVTARSDNGDTDGLLQHSQGPGPFEPGLVVVGDLDGTLLVRVCAGDEELIMLCEGQLIAAVAAAWHDAVGN